MDEKLNLSLVASGKTNEVDIKVCVEYIELLNLLTDHADFVVFCNISKQDQITKCGSRRINRSCSQRTIPNGLTKANALSPNPL